MAEHDPTNGESESFRKIFVGGISTTTTDDSLKEFYSQFGEIEDLIVMRDPTTKRSRGFGFVTFKARSEVDTCMKARPHVIDGKTVDPKRAVPRDANNRNEANVSSKRLYVSGIREGHNEEEFKEYFGKYGTVEKVELVTDKTTGKLRGFGFVTFDDYDPVDQCVLEKSHQLGGHRCDVKKALSKEEMNKAQMQRDRNDRFGRTGRGDMRGGGFAGRGGGRGGFGGGYGGGQGGYGGGGYGAQQGGYGGGYGGQQGGWGEQAQGGWGGQQQGGWGQQGGAAAAGGWGAQGGQQQWGQQGGAAGGWGQQQRY